MNISFYLDLKESLFKTEEYKQDFDFFNKDRVCSSPDLFFSIYTFVVCNSGMKAQIALKIYNKIIDALKKGEDISTVFNHRLKVKAIKEVFNNREILFEKFLNIKDNGVEEILSFCKNLPHIGDITKYHLAKDLGCDVVKPDRHLVRIAAKYNKTPEELCIDIHTITGDRIAAIDFILWRGANLKLI